MYIAERLKWTNKLNQFNESEKKVLLALSHDQYKWRTRDAIKKVTGLEEELVDSTLSGLIQKQLVRPTFSKNKNLVFGLKERVD
jgi:RIO-like serine/threonine protein kinase